ncbi:hypothetical protein BLD44_000045 [Mastigocladus laminosus UU774]|nr:hypothetical protein B4U84_22390 [Westiellopsis prolifica IICB1]TFI55780.1 hypothetical protein BLD44_000045 [Mastigocladus laminosus UU774]
MIYYALSNGVLGSHNCHLVSIFWQIGRINFVGRGNQLIQEGRKQLYRRMDAIKLNYGLVLSLFINQDKGFESSH